MIRERVPQGGSLCTEIPGSACTETCGSTWSETPGSASSEMSGSAYTEMGGSVWGDIFTLAVDCYFDETSRKLVVIDLFANAEAVGFHLGTTAGAHWPELIQVADPGEFLFCGAVPQEMQQAALGMGLNATFAPNVFGFTRN